jgi:hypothetical protein
MRGGSLSFVLATLDNGSASTTHQAPPQADGRGLLRAAEFADRNGVYYPFMKNWIAAGHQVPQTHRGRWAREQSTREALVRTLQLLKRVAQRTHTEYTVIKDCAVPDAVPRDVDVLVPPEMHEAFLEGLADEGLVAVFDNEAEHSFAGPDTMRVDVYNRIHYLGREFLPLEFLRFSRVSKETHGVVHPGLDPSASFLVNSIHGLLGHAAISLLDFLDLCALRDTQGDLAQTRARAEAEGWGRCFDRWVEHVDVLRARVFDEHEAVRFPVRHGHRLVRECLSGIDGGLPGRRGLLDLSLLWDDLVFYSDDSGLTDGLRRSRIATAVANAAGHRLRILRGDRKAGSPVIATNPPDRTRTRFR